LDHYLHREPKVNAHNGWVYSAHRIDLTMTSDAVQKSNNQSEQSRPTMPRDKSQRGPIGQIGLAAVARPGIKA